MGKKLKKKARISNPGPAAYDPSYNLARQNNYTGGKIGGGTRKSRNTRSGNPGPGQYGIMTGFKSGGYRYEFC